MQIKQSMNIAVMIPDNMVNGFATEVKNMMMDIAKEIDSIYPKIVQVPFTNNDKYKIFYNLKKIKMPYYSILSDGIFGICIDANKLPFVAVKTIINEKKEKYHFPFSLKVSYEYFDTFYFYKSHNSVNFVESVDRIRDEYFRKKRRTWIL